MGDSAQEHHVVVVGAGVIGLTTAYLLSQKYQHVTVAAKHMPGDYDIEYASPWAGANYLPVSEEGTEAAEWDRKTWPELEKLARECPEAGIHFQNARRYIRAYSPETSACSSNARTAGKFKGESWYKHIMPNYRALEQSELPPGFSSGSTFTSVVINTPIYLAWLVSQCLKNGVHFQRKTFQHIADARHIQHPKSSHKLSTATVIVNCTGLSAGKLGGVVDANMLPARGQTVLVRNEPNVMADVLGLEMGDEEVCYVMQRAAGGGTILGGSYQLNNSDSAIDFNLANRIMRRALDVCPELLPPSTDHARPVSTNPTQTHSGESGGIEDLDIIRHGVGLRPVRCGGTRIEKERILIPASTPDTSDHVSTGKPRGESEEGVWVVHNYGHGGYGYQSSYGCSQKAVRLVEEILTQSVIASSEET